MKKGDVAYKLTTRPGRRSYIVSNTPYSQCYKQHTIVEAKKDTLGIFLFTHPTYARQFAGHRHENLILKVLLLANAYEAPMIPAVQYESYDNRDLLLHYYSDEIQSLTPRERAKSWRLAMREAPTGSIVCKQIVVLE